MRSEKNRALTEVKAIECIQSGLSFCALRVSGYDLGVSVGGRGNREGGGG